MTTERKKFQVTTFSSSEETVLTLIDKHHVKVPYRGWLEMEIQRWYDKNHRHAWVQENKEGLIAMFSHAEYMMPVEGVE